MRFRAGYYDAYYRKAQQVRTLLTRDFLAAFTEVDVLVAPVTPTPAFKLGEKTDDPVKMYLEDIYSVAASLAGICGMSVPCGETKEGLPIGVQVMGKHFDEATMLRVARRWRLGSENNRERNPSGSCGAASGGPAGGPSRRRIRTSFFLAARARFGMLGSGRPKRVLLTQGCR